MAKVTFTSVEQYLASHPQPMQRILRRVRDVIRKTLPNTVEGIAYQIPAYKLDGANVIFFAGWKEHLSLYPIGDLVAASLGKELARYQLSKGTIKLPWDETLPVHLIARIAKLRETETLARLGAKAAKKVAKKKVAKKKVAKKKVAKKKVAKKATKKRARSRA